MVFQSLKKSSGNNKNQLNKINEKRKWRRKESRDGGRKDFRAENNVGNVYIATLKLLPKKVIIVFD
jgi:hypothetical protein